MILTQKNIFENPFSCDIEKLPPNLQNMEMETLETIDLLWRNDAIQIKYREDTLVDYYTFLAVLQIHNIQIKKN